MNCPNCNKQLNPNQKFCDSCGFAIVPDPLNAKNTQRIFDTPNNNAPDAPGYGSGVYPSYQAAPAQPQYQEPYYAQPQPYGGGPQPPEKKNNMPLIIIIIVLAVLLVAGGIVAAILLLNNKGDKGSDSSSSAEVTSSGVIDESSSNQDSDSSDDDSSSKRESSSRASSRYSSRESSQYSSRESSRYSSRESSRYSSRESSRYSSRESSRVDSDSNKLYNDSGVLVADDPSINVNDTTTQLLLKSVESTIASQMSQINSSAGEYLTAREYVKGNTLVMEIKFKPSVSETEKSAFLSGFNKSLSSSMPGLDSLKEKGITVAMVIAIHNSDGSLYYSKVFS